ncbi:MAG: tRNA-dihydrouridine synthase family protein [Bdellovibrionota bacterium]|nr:tRNA-dihydrouridine synthase family protein [Bdellovibrionota bacterium]
MKNIDWKNKLILAPLTKGGNLPFRRLCEHFGADITVSEMAYAYKLFQGDRKEKALLRRTSKSGVFGVQLAAENLGVAIDACQMAIDEGADFIDLNCGCPINDTVKRKMGSHLLQKPKRLAKLVEGMVRHSSIPITVKIRSGWDEKNINAIEVSKELESAGASAITLHGRTRSQRYSKKADWDLIARIVQEVDIPIIGNGDILTFYEAEQRKEKSLCASLMIGRGALIKPWIFKEIKEKKSWDLSAQEKIEVYSQFAESMKDYFGHDDYGIKRATPLLAWHFSFLSKYHPLSKEEFEMQSKEHPLLQTRLDYPEEWHKDPLNKILSSPNEQHHWKLAEIFLNSKSPTKIEACIFQLN